MSMDVMFNEQEPYFTNPYPQGKSLARENNKDFLPDLFSHSVFKSPRLSHMPRPESKTVFEPEF